MGQKANLLTIRKKINIEFITHNTRTWMSLFNTVANLNRLFFFKGAWVTHNSLGFENNTVFFTFYLFYKYATLTKYNKKLCKVIAPNFKKKTSNRNLFFLLKKQILQYGFNFYVLKLKNLNYILKKSKRSRRQLYRRLKRFVKNIFARKLKLFFDVLKATVLLQRRGITSSFYTKILGLVLKFISKRLHSRFLHFIKALLKTITFAKILGIKFLLSGRYRGKERASSKLIRQGNIPNQTLKKNVEFSCSHVYTLYGVFGIKTWVYFK
jgi:hypothetical protein